MLNKIALLLAFCAIPALAQVEMEEANPLLPPKFYYDALNFRDASGGSRIDLYFQIPYSELQFVKEGNQFVSAFEISVLIDDEDGNSVLEKSWNEDVACNSFDETVNPNIFSSSQRSYSLVPGVYLLQVSLIDSVSQKSVRFKRDFVARNFHQGDVSMSDIMLLRSSSETAGRHTIVPNVEGNIISEHKTFPIFYEVYFPHTDDSVLVTTTMTGEKEKPIYKSTSWLKGTSDPMRVFADIPKDSIPMGIYKLEVALNDSASDETSPASASYRVFSLHYPDLPLTITNLDKAADEMLYVASSSTIDTIKDVKNPAAKEKLFLQFWQKFNPNPSSFRNPPMYVYYARVAYANAHFTHYYPGWKSDMGKIYILFGPPNSVDRHPFNVDTKPYEIWYYFTKNRKFVFEDYTGFGDYRLLNPDYDADTSPSGPDF